MAPVSASKQKRLAEKAAKQAAKNKGVSDTSTTNTSTPSGSTYGGSSTNTPLTSLSAATSTDDLTSMAKLQLATDRYVLRILRLDVSNHLLFAGVQLVFLYPIQRVVISRLTHTLSHSTEDYLSKVPRCLSTTAKDTVFWVKMVLER